MPIEVVGLIYHSESTESHSLPPSSFSADFIQRSAQAFEAAGYDRVLLGQTATWPDNLTIAAFVAAATTTLKFMIAQRPGFIAPAIAARKLATIDHLSRGRAGVHIITAASDIETQCDGDFLKKEERYLRSYEYVGLLRRLWSETEPVSHEGPHFTLRGASTAVKPYRRDRIPVFWGGTSPIAIEKGADCADIYAMGGGRIVDVAAQVATIAAAAAARGRTLRYCMSMRILIGTTEADAWDKAGALLDRVMENQRKNGPVGRAKDDQDAAGAQNLRTASLGDRLEDCLWTGLTKATGGRLHATTLVGSVEQVVDALVKYYDAGIDHFLITGFDPIPDVLAMGRELIPQLRARTQDRKRPSAAVAPEPQS